MVKLSTNRYGKSLVRLVKVIRNGSSHDMLEWSVEVTVEGDFETCFTEGDNSKILPTDTMKNTVYSLARCSNATCIEEFGKELAGYLLANNPQIESVRVEIAQKLWERIVTAGQVHQTAFQQTGPEVWTTAVNVSHASGTIIQSGIKGLMILKTAGSAFVGYIKDKLTTLPETTDRLLCTEATISWTYSKADLSFLELRRVVTNTLLEVFAKRESPSVQHTIYAMGQAVLIGVPDVSEIDILMPNRHCLLINLSPFGQDNPNEIFVPTDEPHGTIQAKLVRE